MYMNMYSQYVNIYAYMYLNTYIYVCLCIYDIYARVHTVIDVDYWNTNLFIDQVLSS